MTRTKRHASVSLLASVLVGLTACRGDTGPRGRPAEVVVDVSTAAPETLESLDVVSEITSVRVGGQTTVNFTLKSESDVPVVGLVPFWQANSRFVRFTITKLVAGRNGDPDRWVAYVRDGGEPDYDTGSALVDHGDGSYTFTFATDVRNVPGIAYEPALTHRVAGQIGQLRTVPLEEQNVWFDFVPNGSAVSHTRNIVVMDSCNECHDNLVFHGRRFETQYCTQCHNSDLAGGEGNFAFMIHRIHAAGTFTILDDGVDFSELTYPQDLANCRKCHDEDDAVTANASNWRTLPNIEACDGCHNVFATGTHSGPAVTDNQTCVLCHAPGEVEDIVENHTLPNRTLHNPELFPGQREIAYELLEAEVDGATNELTIQFRITSDGDPLDLTNLPADLVDPGTMSSFRYPGFLLAYAMPQDGIDEPADYNNMGNRSAQPLSLRLDDFMPIELGAPIGLLSFDAPTGVMTAVVTDAASQFPMGATLRAVGLQSYLRQDLDGDGSYDVNLHTPSAVVAVTGDQVRREVVDPSSCSNCHEWFEGHGGSRVFAPGSDIICTMCHVPNLSSSGRTIDPLDNDLAAELGPDPLVFPEDAQNFKDMIHGIHSEGFRTREFEHVRGGRQGYYDWSEITFPRGASTSNCSLCHLEGTNELPLAEDLLPTTVRTTGVLDGQDPDLMTVETAFMEIPNATDWVNSPTASSCFYCHTSDAAWAHMSLNGGMVSAPAVGDVPPAHRESIEGAVESCTICHGPGRVADLDAVHNR